MEEFISLRTDTSLKVKFEEVKLTQFWGYCLQEYPLLCMEAISYLVAFPTTWECETPFSQMNVIKSIHRNRLNVENDLRIALSTTIPEFDVLVKAKQLQDSH